LISIKINIIKIDGGALMQKVTGDMIVSDIIKIDRGTIPILMNAGMHCLGCPSATGESLEDACAVHGIDANQLVIELNKYLETVDK
jgi:hybrid cluster-associated redox disulfide protein